jgi:hypothetical protein
LSDLLNATRLAEEENYAHESPFCPMPLDDEEFTVANAVDRLRRIAYHNGKIDAINAQVVDLCAPLLAEIERIKEWSLDEKERPLASIAHHESWLGAYYRANPPAKGKTVSLPGGALSERDQQPEWTYANDEAVLAWLEANASGYVRRKPTIAKDELKKALIINPDGTVAFPESGEVLPGVTVTTRPAKFTVKVG